jgi:hypothetical protein
VPDRKEGESNFWFKSLPPSFTERGSRLSLLSCNPGVCRASGFSDTPCEGENDMREISQEILDHLPDPIARLVWEKWIAEGTARLIPAEREVQRCSAQ